MNQYKGEAWLGEEPQIREETITETVSADIIVVGGGLVGCETALWLAQQGKKVTIVEALDKLMAVNGPLCHANKDMLSA